LFHKIRFENKINIEMWGGFEILESYVGERVNKIRFDGSINRETRFRSCQYVQFNFWEKEARREKRPREAAICKTKVRVSLTFNIIKL